MGGGGWGTVGLDDGIYLVGRWLGVGHVYLWCLGSRLGGGGWVVGMMRIFLGPPRHYPWLATKKI